MNNKHYTLVHGEEITIYDFGTEKHDGIRVKKVELVLDAKIQGVQFKKHDIVRFDKEGFLVR